MHTIATLHALKAHLNITQDNTTQDARLLSVLTAATRTLEATCKRTFMPYYATIPHALPRHGSKTLVFVDDLLRLDGIAQGQETLGAQDVYFLSDWQVQRRDGARFFAYEGSLYVAGVWGWRKPVSEAWHTHADALTASITADALTALVADVDAPQADGTPRFQVGQLLAFGDEFAHVIGVNTSTNALTLSRGVRGTTASAHPIGQAISIFSPASDVVQMCLAWAAWLYREADAPAVPPASLTFALAPYVRAVV
jgi:hypothetical protein